MFPKWAWSGSREQFLHCGLRKFRESKSSVYRWYTQLYRRRFVYDTYKTMKATRTRHGWVHMFITRQPTLTLQLHNFNLFRTCRTSSFCTVAWQLATFQLTQRIARSLGDSWASCLTHLPMLYNKLKPHPQKWPNQKLTCKTATITVVVQVNKAGEQHLEVDFTHSSTLISAAVILINCWKIDADSLAKCVL